MIRPSFSPTPTVLSTRDKYEISAMATAGKTVERLEDGMHSRALIILSHKNIGGYVIPEWQLSDRINQSMPGLIALLSPEGDEVNNWALYDFFELPRVILLGLSPKEVLVGKRDAVSENPNFNIDAAREQFPDTYAAIDKLLGSDFEGRLQAVKDAIEDYHNEP